MNTAEDFMAESLDEMIRRARLGQNDLHISPAGGRKQISAKAPLVRGTAALDRLMHFRSKFSPNASPQRRTRKNNDEPS
jgi:hypothetical protein